MKKSALLLLLLPFFIVSCGDDDKKGGGNALIKGKFSECNNDTLFLTDVSRSTFEVLDSVVVGSDGEFEFHPTIKTKGFFNITVGRSGQQFATIIAEAGDTINITGNAKNLGYTWKTSGSEDCDRYSRFNDYVGDLDKKRQPLMGRLDSLTRTFQVIVNMLKDTTKVDSLDKVFSDLYTKTQNQLLGIDSSGSEWVRHFIDEKPGSFANIPALRLLEPFDNLAYYEKTATALEVKYKDAPNVKMLRDFIERERPFSKGQTPPEIAMNDPDGKPLKLSSLRGKVVLIDFWASWCGPCMAELPTVVANYKKYHDKGFEVFSVSLDSDKNAWVGAIKQKGLIWPYHVSDLMQWKSMVVPLYRIKSIPKTVLLDREGRIIDRDLRGEALSSKLDEIFSKSK